MTNMTYQYPVQVKDPCAFEMSNVLYVDEQFVIPEVWRSKRMSMLFSWNFSSTETRKRLVVTVQDPVYSANKYRVPKGYIARYKTPAEESHRTDYLVCRPFMLHPWDFLAGKTSWCHTGTGTVVQCHFSDFTANDLTLNAFCSHGGPAWCGILISYGH